MAVVTKTGSPEFVPIAERIALFDNDGTLWAEQPTFFQALFAFDRIRQLAPQRPEWKTREPFASVLRGDEKSALAGGMHALVKALTDCASSFGATIRYGEEVSEVLIASGRANGVRLASGERIAADAVIVNADVGAVAVGVFGGPVRRAAATIPPSARSLSAMNPTKRTILYS